MGVFIKFRNVKIRIWGDEVEYIILVASAPVFPSFVPSFHKHLVKTMACGKVDIATDVFIVGRVSSVRSCACVVGLAELYGRKIICIVPGAFSRNHFPPYAYIFYWSYPVCVVICARLVEVEDQT